ncbi:MAG: class I SAM-dependent methyltransferase [Pseudonocardiaceae bacterium]
MDQRRVEEFLGTVVSEMATVEAAATAYLGDQLGLYRAMSGAGPLTSQALAEHTGTQERLVREWCHAQVAGGYLDYCPSSADSNSETFELPPEHAAVLADPDSPVYLAGILEIAAAMWASTDRVAAAFRDGGGVGWHEHDPRLFHGVARLFGPIYRHQLISEWIPALDGVEDQLRAGARVADVGCGHGVSTIALAQAFPAAFCTGFDYHEPSIDAARKAAAEAGVGDRARFEVAAATALPADGYDLICFFDCLHDMGDPVGAARCARSALTDNGTVLLVEPKAGDDLTENINPVSRLYYAGSVFLCTPSSLAQEGARSLGAQAGQARLAEVFREAGFTRFRRATESPFNLVLEARP